MASKRQKILLGTAGAAASTLLGLKIFAPNITDDIKTVRKSNELIRQTAASIANGEFFIDTFEKKVAMHPRKTFVIFEDRHYSYGYVNEMANRIANVALTWDLKPGDVVATLICNEPAHIWTLLGLLKVGLTDAFINFNLTSKPLVHSLNVSQAKSLIVGKDDSLLQSIRDIEGQLPKVPIYVQGKSQSELPEGYLSLQDAMDRSLPVQVARAVRSSVTPLSPMCFIYTSGTTGLPKPVIINQSKGVILCKGFSVIDGTCDDIAYAVTPLYHSAAHLALSGVINFGATIVIRRSFSVTSYWEDVRKHHVTVLTYIGELLRYLLSSPKAELDGVHNVRVAVGNGLRPDIWADFQKRFKIPRIVEFFGATEAPTSLVNFTGKVGAVGRWSPVMSMLSIVGNATRFIKYDPIEDTAYRDTNGRCVEIKRGEEGLMISPLPPSYTGLYHNNPEQTEKKILRDVFVKGDAYFSFGDILYLDKDYYIYFRDRVGDTFRWKGENVSTREVCDAISTLDFVNDVNIYGVKVPGSEGRAGMASIVLKKNVNITPTILKALYRKCERELPSYARPLFLRFQGELEITQTMKHRKIELVKEGFDPSKTSDPLFFMDRKSNTYSPLNSVTVYQTVLNSRL